MSALTNRELVELVFTGKLPPEESEPPTSVIYDGSAEMVMFLGRVINMRNSKEERIQNLLKACHLPPAKRIFENDHAGFLKPYLACFMDRATWERHVLPLKASQEKRNKVVQIADLLDERESLPVVNTVDRLNSYITHLTKHLGINHQSPRIDGEETSLDKLFSTLWDERISFHQQRANAAPEVIEIDGRIEALVQEVFSE